MILKKSELAEELHVSCSRVTQFIQRGMPVRVDGRVDLRPACEWVVNNLDPHNEGMGENGSVARAHASELLAILDLSAARRRAPREEMRSDQ
jgi:hypothetical protein